jgi:TrmH family RNA methyltransferase
MIESLSKNKFSFIKSLQQPKFRQKYQKFTVEGHKSITEFLNYRKFVLEYIVTTDNEWAAQNDTKNINILICKQEEMKALSNLVTATPLLGVFQMTDYKTEDILKTESPVLLLDGIQDPGNFGTILRSADWFGINHILRTSTSADFYHPKVVQATMGSLNNLIFSTLEDYSNVTGKTLIGMDMKGKEINLLQPQKHMIFVMGSEGQGISDEIQSLCTYNLTIPGDENKVAESLNVGIAAGILLFHIAKLSGA